MTHITERTHKDLLDSIGQFSPQVADELARRISMLEGLLNAANGRVRDLESAASIERETLQVGNVSQTTEHIVPVAQQAFAAIASTDDVQLHALATICEALQHVQGIRDGVHGARLGIVAGFARDTIADIEELRTAFVDGGKFERFCAELKMLCKEYCISLHAADEAILVCDDDAPDAESWHAWLTNELSECDDLEGEDSEADQQQT